MKTMIKENTETGEQSTLKKLCAVPSALCPSQNSKSISNSGKSKFQALGMIILDLDLDTNKMYK
jgi:hypothetical protein